MSKSSQRVRRNYKIIAILSAGFTTLIVLLIIMASTVFTPDFRSIIDDNSNRYGIDNRLVYAVIMAESGYDSQAKSPKGAIGLMQIMPSTAEWLSDAPVAESDLYNPKYNIELGVKLLSMYFTKYNDFYAVLCAYNAGEGNLAKWLRNEIDISEPPYKETADYIRRVKFYYNIYSTIYLPVG